MHQQEGKGGSSWKRNAKSGTVHTEPSFIHTPQHLKGQLGYKRGCGHHLHFCPFQDQGMTIQARDFASGWNSSWLQAKLKRTLEDTWNPGALSLSGSHWNPIIQWAPQALLRPSNPRFKI